MLTSTFFFVQAGVITGENVLKLFQYAREKKVSRLIPSYQPW
jgi:hypothetical protein